MSETERIKMLPENSNDMKNDGRTPVGNGLNKCSLLGKFDGPAMIQAVVMSELLGKPKAKTRKRGHLKK